MTPAGLAALLTERDNLVVALQAAEDAREDALQEGAEWARLLDEEKTALAAAKTYQADLKTTIVTLRDEAAADAKTITRLRREVAKLTTESGVPDVR